MKVGTIVKVINTCLSAPVQTLGCYGFVVPVSSWWKNTNQNNRTYVYFSYGPKADWHLREELWEFAKKLPERASSTFEIDWAELRRAVQVFSDFIDKMEGMVKK